MNSHFSPSGCIIRDRENDPSTYDLFFNELGNDKECAQGVSDSWDTACICDGQPYLSRPLTTPLGQPLAQGWQNHDKGWQKTPRGLCEPSESSRAGHPRYIRPGHGPNQSSTRETVITDAKWKSALCTKKEVQDPGVCADICNRDCQCRLYEYDPVGGMCTFFPDTNDLDGVSLPDVPDTIVCIHWYLGHSPCRACEKNDDWEPECEGDSDRYKPQSPAR